MQKFSNISSQVVPVMNEAVELSLSAEVMT